MKKITLTGKSGKCAILVGEKISGIGKFVPKNAGKIVIITDKNVRKALGKNMPKYPIIEIGAGEGYKTLATVEKVYAKFAQMEIDRNSFVIGIGGGNVCDVAGYAASTYLRGVKFGFAPTTLTAQADAAIGGKNGVNLDGYKNLVGRIQQPEFVVCDVELLAALPAREIRCGLAEIIKHAAICDTKLFAWIGKYMDEILNKNGNENRNRKVIEEVVFRSAKIKAKIVEKDEFEKNERKMLNFGHTVGHAIEKCACIPHGEAVAIGMVLEAEMAVKMGALDEKECEKLWEIILLAGLPTSTAVDAKKLVDAMKKDKKRNGGSIRMPILLKIGKCELRNVKFADVEAALYDLY